MAPNLRSVDFLRINELESPFPAGNNEHESPFPAGSEGLFDSSKKTCTREIWRGRQRSNHLPTLCDSVSRALRSIHILDSQHDNGAWLNRFDGELHDVDDGVLHTLVSQAPEELAARVADSNGNLLYEMQNQTGEMNVLLNRLGISNKLGAVEYLGSYLTTESTIPQPAHVDYTWDVLDDSSNLYLAFFPLTKDGMFLQVWPRNDRADLVVGELVFIPYGRMLVLPASTIHGGGFRTTPKGEQGNLRFHLYFVRGPGGKLPTHQTNKYTEPHDKRRELCERYVDHQDMTLLQDSLFI